MSKTYSGCLQLLTVLVFSTATTPTFVASRDLSPAQHDDEENSIAILAGFLEPVERAALPRQYSEDGGLMRFGIDEFNLPSLEIELPDLFDWSDSERLYLARLDHRTVDIGHALDSTTAVVFRTHSTAPQCLERAPRTV